MEIGEVRAPNAYMDIQKKRRRRIGVNRDGLNRLLCLCFKLSRVRTIVDLTIVVRMKGSYVLVSFNVWF